MFRNPFYQPAADGSPHIIYLYDIIGEYYWEDSVSAKNVIGALAMAGGEDVLIKINCSGGNVQDGISIYNTLAGYDGKVDFLIEGFCCSMATGVICAVNPEKGGKVSICETALCMIHRASTAVHGNRNEIAEALELLEKVDESLAIAYARRFGKSEDEVLDFIDQRTDTWLTAKEAVELGLADESVDPREFTVLLGKDGAKSLGNDEGGAILAQAQLPPAMIEQVGDMNGLLGFRAQAGGKFSGITSQADTPEGDSPSVGDSGEETPEAQPAPSPEASLDDDRKRASDIAALAGTQGLANSPIVSDLIKEGVSVDAAGKIFAQIKSDASLNNQEDEEVPVQTPTSPVASWDTVYNPKEGV